MSHLFWNNFFPIYNTYFGTARVLSISIYHSNHSLTYHQALESINQLMQNYSGLINNFYFEYKICNSIKYLKEFYGDPGF